jgi:two-component system, OmpR family, phosphate regulon sensor histidine kinase PhoR
LTIALVAAVGALVMVVARTGRERRRVLRLLGARSGSLTDAASRVLRERVARAELSHALLTRDTLLEAIPAPAIIIAPDATVERVNHAAGSLPEGLTPGAAIADVDAELGEAVDLVLGGVASMTREVTIDEPARRTFEVHLRRVPSDDAAGAIALLLDITANVDFRESRRLFSAAVSHELRTPLARILGLVETLALPQSQAERDALVAQTEIEVDNLRRLIDEMLLLAALDRGEVMVSDETADAGASAEAVIADRGARRASRKRALSVDATRGLSVPLPARLLEVVIGNLVDNALRHAGPDAAVFVSVRQRDSEVEVAVRDDGVGIAPQHLPHVFERFYRGEASRAGPGTGLGLAVVKHIVEAHRGRVQAESSVGCGTTVRLFLPLSGQPTVGVGSNR